MKVFTIGHSTRPIEEFIDLLRANHISQLVDIRTIPNSRHNPQFGSQALAASARIAAIGYTHIKALGGLRRPRPDSPNMGWRNQSFRGYADYMQTAEFEAALDSAIEILKQGPTAFMCAEAVPWRCHRSLVADALTVRGMQVGEIISLSPPKPHQLTSFAEVQGTKITYSKEKDREQLKLL